MKINKNNCMQIILDTVPDFKEYWNEYLDFWGSTTERGLCNDLGAFSRFISNILQENKPLDLKGIFELMEYFMIHGTDEVQTAVATCFLENLINYCSHGRIHPSSFVHLLGKESREYCKAWDEFCGVKTEGLWP